MLSVRGRNESIAVKFQVQVFARAAEELFITQPALKFSIRCLSSMVAFYSGGRRAVYHAARSLQFH